MVKRPWRAEVFAAIARELACITATSILELGSGPGFLAQYLLATLPIATYQALDFSAAMHDLARERLGPAAERVTFIEKDFSRAGWAEGLALPDGGDGVDGVVTMQAVHELRHKRHAPAFYGAVRTLLKPGGLLLVCDHIVGESGLDDEELYMTLDEQLTAILEGGFSKVDLVMKKGGLALFRSQKEWR